MSKTIYIVLTETGSLLSRAIQMYTQENFNHVSIALDPELKEMYSFGRKQENNPLIGGFVQEDVHSKLLRKANCAIYEYKISDKQYEMLREEIAFFKRDQDKFKYNFLGLICVACRNSSSICERQSMKSPERKMAISPLFSSTSAVTVRGSRLPRAIRIWN